MNKATAAIEPKTTRYVLELLAAAGCDRAAARTAGDVTFRFAIGLPARGVPAWP